ncbi:MAG: GH32 C-terminal domain-containing protein [Chthoniobacterales bacterium]|nr:GH32 C-terminal domain-containing protein [Chthoniobacterales bacterium]
MMDPAGNPWPLLTPIAAWQIKAVALSIVALFGGTASGFAAYDEPYRPQYHFSAKRGWIGDPDGLVRYNGLYHLFWWGHAVSDDLVFWRQLPYPMRGDDGSFVYFSGSVVIDHSNSSGFGTGGLPPWVAIYTAHRKSDNFDEQSISFSADGSYFDYYPKNPVLSLGGMPCRDPDVFWHEESARWIMLVVAPEKRKILFYSSADLKSWDYLSEFGPMGARAGNWEVPNLLRLRKEEDPSSWQWVLVCSMGPNKIQYFPGEFDGKQFSIDNRTWEFLESGIGLPGKVYADFESVEAMDGWTAEGAAFQSPASSRVDRISGHLGRGLVRSNVSGSSYVGRLVSPEFTITHPNINFLLAGGGKLGEVAVNLIIDGKPVRSSKPDSPEAMKWRGWNVSELVGKTATIEILDRSEERGFVAVDHIMFSDTLIDTGREQASWVDWGHDFYAARAWRDADRDDPEEYWIGWMGNWEYANDVPTSWGRGVQSIPRELSIKASPRGGQIRQRPLTALQQLRQKGYESGPLEISGTMAVPEFTPELNAYEIEAVFDLNDAAGRFGLNLCVGGRQKVVVGYDASARNVFVDRRESGDVSFNQAFPSVVAAPLFAQSKELKLRIFVDQSSVEVFVNDGEAVLTSLIFHDSEGVGVQLFSSDGPAKLQNLKAWSLRSIWAARN